MAIALLVASGCAGVRGPAGATWEAIARPDGPPLIVHTGTPAGAAPHPLILYLDGSGCRSAVDGLPYLSALRDMGYAFAAPEKRGVGPGDDGRRCTDEFLSTNDRAQRLADGRAVVARAGERFPRWDGRLVVVGTSEGAAVAAGVAATSPGTAALAFVAAGGLSQADELRILRARALDARSAPAEERARVLGDLERGFDAARAAPTSRRTWLGRDNTYRRWASYLWYEPLGDLERVDAPIYLAHGTRDASSPVESADAIAARFRRIGKANLTYRRVEGLDHAHVSDVLNELAAWLLATVPPQRRTP